MPTLNHPHAKPYLTMDEDEISSSLLTLLIIWQTRRFLDTKNRLPQWDWWLKNYWFINVALIGLSTVTDEDFPLRLIWLIALGMVGYTVHLLSPNQAARTAFLAVAPFMFLMSVFKVIEDLFPKFAKTYSNFTDSTVGFSLVWLVAFLIVASRQKKALIKLEQEREIEAAERRKIEARKQELEYLVAQRTAEITSQKEELEQALTELKATQNQLIHSEKMASLGELTAGIAHEIQNPLNFVNNFAEVSVELIDEIADEHHKPNPDPQLTDELLTDLRQNLQKISQHGSRASSIVRGMLQHSRASSGQREPTDLNALCEEYLRLAYHGLRAKDKTFNASFSTELDASLGLVTVVPQDLGRVLLNLYTNAFYAVQSRQKTAQEQASSYQPTVTVTTECIGNEVRIRVRDNGVGMPESILSKIFQPFFTTKPTGEGTGLGLSLSYDIITKGHGGTIEARSREGEGTEFIIELPA
ncbi:signal transduction histidine kinase [Spirosoma lacussanchae]